MLELNAVIFDMDGLMIDTEPVGKMLVKTSHEKFGYEITEEMFYHLIGTNEKTSKAYYHSVFGEDYPYQKIKDYRDQLRKEYFNSHPLEVKKGLYDLLEDLKKKKMLFVAGGVGTAPVYPQVKWLHEHGIDADVVIGAKTEELLILEEEMKAVAGRLYVCTDDGSYGTPGMVTTVIEELVQKGNQYDVCIAIGPMIMMKFVCLLTKDLGIPTIVSMNPIMVDGTGMCGACRLQVGDEIKFACVDGPEFDGHLVDFDQAMERQTLYRTLEGRAMLKLKEGATHHGGCGNCGGND